MLIQTDARRRITLPPKAGIKPGDTFDLDILPDGRMVLVPVTTIPTHQLWAWSPEVRAAAAASLADERPSTAVDSAREANETARRWENTD